MKQAADGLEIQILSSPPLASAADVEPRVIAGIRDGAQGLLARNDGILYPDTPHVVALAAKNRLPAVYPTRDWADAGGLVSFGFNFHDALCTAAGIVDRILKGARPADIPSESLKRFELVVNRKAALAQGISVPSAVLARSDEVIR
jgi:putative ABC transport system substrate-binding protein